MRISDWSSDVCSSDLLLKLQREYNDYEEIWKAEKAAVQGSQAIKEEIERTRAEMAELQRKGQFDKLAELQYGKLPELEGRLQSAEASQQAASASEHPRLLRTQVGAEERSEEHTSELQSLMRISYAVFCLKK